MKKVALISFVLLLMVITGCAGQVAYIKSGKILESQDYEGALKVINEVLVADPENKRFNERKAEIVKAYLIALEDEYSSINKNDLSGEMKNLEKRKSLIESLLADYTTIIAFEEQSYVKEFEAHKDRRKKVDENILTYSEGVKNKNLKQIVSAIMMLKDYRGYDQTVDQIFEKFSKNFPLVEAVIENYLQEYNYENARLLVNSLSDGLGGRETLIECNSELVEAYNEKLDEHKDNGNYMLSAAYAVILKEIFYQDTYPHYNILISDALKKYKSNIYVKINGYLFESTEHPSSERVVELLNRNLNDTLVHVGDPNRSDIILILNVKRKEHNVISSGPEKVYSRFVSGYQRVKNQYYYQVVSDLSMAQSEYNRLASQPNTNPYAALGNSIAMIGWSRKIRKLNSILGSSAIYDNVPIYADYSFVKDEFTIDNQLSIEYSLYDRVSKEKIENIPFEKIDNRDVIIKQGVHQKDANGYNNSGKLDYEKENERFIEFLEKTIEGLSNELSQSMARIYTSRYQVYRDMKKNTLALDRYFLAKVYEDPQYLFSKFTKNDPGEIIKSLPCHIDELSPRENLPKDGFTYDDVVLASVIKREPEKVESNNDKEEYYLPFMEESIRKVVDIEVITPDGIKGGSGFFVNTEGYIITNYHVVAGGTKINIKNADGQMASARVIMSDSYSDLVLLKVEIQSPQFFELRRYNTLKTGEIVYAIGSPHGYEKTLSTGIISAKRNLPLPFSGGNNLMQIQTDAAITHGNSGGPLLDNQGRVVGINTWTENIKGTTGPLNFAISVEEAIKRFGYYIQ